jgi:polar amino acid transport system substrate-binding protein
MGETVLRNSPLRRPVLSLCALVLLVCSFPLRAETMKVCYDQWPPMTMFPTAKEPRRGVVIDMLSDIYRKAGVTLEFFEVPYERGMRMVADGLCDMLPEKEFSPIRDEGYVYANQETFRYPTAFVVRRGDPWRYSGVQSVHGKRVATGPGWNYASMSEAYQAFLDDTANKNLVEIVSGESDVVDRILLMMIAGRVDLYADNLMVLQYIVNANGLSEKLEIVGPGLEKMLIEKPIFSSKLSPGKRAKWMKIWDDGRVRMTKKQEATFLQSYGVQLPGN